MSKTKLLLGEGKMLVNEMKTSIKKFVKEISALFPRIFEFKQFNLCNIVNKI